MRLDFECDFLEHIRWYDVHFIQNHQTPLAILNKLHHFLRLVRAAFGLRHHGVRRDDNSCVPCELVLLISGEDCDVRWIDVGPFEELGTPLNDGHGGSTKNNDTLFHGAGGGNSNKSLASAARQNDNTTSGAAVTKHLAEGLLLVRSDLSSWFEINVQVGVDFI